MSRSKNSIESKALILLGSGGHASVVADVLKRLDWCVLGVVSSVPPQVESCFGWKHLGSDAVLVSFDPTEVELVNGIGTLPGESRRRDMARKYRKDGFKFITILDPSAMIGFGTELAEGVQIIAGAIVQPNCKIGRAP